MTNRMDEIAAVLPAVERVARDAHYAYGIPEDEAYGLLSLEVVERAKDYLILHREGQTGLIERRLMNVAAVHARQDRVRRIHEDDQYYYDPEYVRLFLPFAFAYEDWANGPTNEDSQAEYATAEALDTALDVKAAWPRLKDWQSTVIVERHCGQPNEDGGTDWDRIAEVIGRKNGKSAREAYSSATRELTVEMNTARERRSREHEGPGGRKAVSNAQAAALISAGK
ncbi:hypothetical protein [Micromonospora andamanensis]|uniref:hypothetical protein n=1 Tax=Micromonospora andamanensis TaxID=1287068 RepID=UPI001951C080|nr:hypothetical protein [Micromonospora andamanensis]GIJ38491.1 hypothetical protein Vwe01_18160 [Micromonospora andamanensis]